MELIGWSCELLVGVREIDAQHSAEHDKLSGTVFEFQSLYDAGDRTVSIELMNFLRDWLPHHIHKSVKQLGAALSRLGVT